MFDSDIVYRNPLLSHIAPLPWGGAYWWIEIFQYDDHLPTNEC